MNHFTKVESQYLSNHSIPKHTTKHSHLKKKKSFTRPTNILILFK